MIQINLLKPYQTPIEKMGAAALAVIRGRSFSGRNPHLGKMINCQVCGLRHRQNERKCEQKFTFVVKGREVYRENEEGILVPDYRTAVPADSKPTRRQILGSAAFARKRLHPHPSKIKLVFVERVREIMGQLGYDGTEEVDEAFQGALSFSRKQAMQTIAHERGWRPTEFKRRGIT